jgi:hypothetical protein
MVHYAAPTSAQLAHALLRAWICGNKPLFTRLLIHGTSACSPEAPSVESERLELLTTVGGRMGLCPAWSREAVPDPGIEWCLDMLEHLAFTQTATFASGRLE